MSEESSAAAAGPPAASAALSITTSQPRPGMICIRLVGEIDIATAQQLRTELLSAIAAAPARTEIRVDLAGMTFIDATGIGALVRAKHAASRAGVSFVLDRPQGVVLRVLDVLDLVEVLAARGQPVPRPGWPLSG